MKNRPFSSTRRYSSRTKIIVHPIALYALTFLLSISSSHFLSFFLVTWPHLSTYCCSWNLRLPPIFLASSSLTQKNFTFVFSGFSYRISFLISTLFTFFNHHNTNSHTPKEEDYWASGNTDIYLS